MDILNDVIWPNGVKEAIEREDVEKVKKIMKTADDFLSQFSPQMITVEEFKEDLKNLENLVIFDLRDKKSFDDNSIKNSINVPFGLGLTEKVRELGTKKIILTCFAGKISSVAGDLLRKEGFSNVYVLQAGMMGYSNNFK
ncbi:MAG: molybdopterin biosynthesis-like protein MoeZ [Candidatus Methanofastidiosum methylothiophilum]|uniref:Molybdopterin biosynthesis-like protein MoeZ n=1 Tax=Candidatus Methanofastidiosum methylothiophilum TaxID=1705564 RepID=A0A150IZI1_9EURY|nr:MAG: molybdopterin biosynthesis-like protein MoeZ [Candidatus Methanofastidiosum methylthiophilus]KYC47901.1 MAG: molybdopterin biosynthesis-like protein MoeZ [Candidatus Methanofastidiosum methylthiophilus]KYC50074.1 MAG: molybdopterin biosynthesis-like protein MoeZ [Candidatus Methanofastidiosum methylthiophilus]